MKTELITTGDGSHTLYVPELSEHYHSLDGAVNESSHVFIQEGLLRLNKKELNIFEVGFGTGLNTYLTYNIATELNLYVVYHTIDNYQLPESLYKKLNYPEVCLVEDKDPFLKIHHSKWNTKVRLSDQFELMKILADIRDYTLLSMYDLIYFDAFAPDKQPELWELSVFQKIFKSMNPGGILVTYSAKGDVRRLLSSIGFSVQKRPGPGKKFHMTLAVKPVV